MIVPDTAPGSDTGSIATIMVPIKAHFFFNT